MIKEARSTASKAVLPRQFRRIRIELAREPGHPEGSRQHGYTLIAPLDARDRIDLDLWKLHRDACRVVRFRPDEEDEIGHLVRKPNGDWVFHYDVRGNEEDEAGYRLGSEHFIIGEYVSIHEEGSLHTFQVTSVEHV